MALGDLRPDASARTPRPGRRDRAHPMVPARTARCLVAARTARRHLRHRSNHGGAGLRKPAGNRRTGGGRLLAASARSGRFSDHPPHRRRWAGGRLVGGQEPILGTASPGAGSFGIGHPHPGGRRRNHAAKLEPVHPCPRDGQPVCTGQELVLQFGRLHPMGRRIQDSRLFAQPVFRWPGNRRRVPLHLRPPLRHEVPGQSVAPARLAAQPLGQALHRFGSTARRRRGRTARLRGQPARNGTNGRHAGAK